MVFVTIMLERDDHLGTRCAIIVYKAFNTVAISVNVIKITIFYFSVAFGIVVSEKYYKGINNFNQRYLFYSQASPIQ